MNNDWRLLFALPKERLNVFPARICSDAIRISTQNVHPRVFRAHIQRIQWDELSGSRESSFLKTGSPRLPALWGSQRTNSVHFILIFLLRCDKLCTLENFKFEGIFMNSVGFTCRRSNFIANQCKQSDYCNSVWAVDEKFFKFNPLSLRTTSGVRFKTRWALNTNHQSNIPATSPVRLFRPIEN